MTADTYELLSISLDDLDTVQAVPNTEPLGQHSE
jgi:hypothetical protein